MTILTVYISTLSKGGGSDGSQKPPEHQRIITRDMNTGFNVMVIWLSNVLVIYTSSIYFCFNKNKGMFELYLQELDLYDDIYIM